MSGPKTTLALIEDIVLYRDRLPDLAPREMLTDAANELSRLNAQRTELLNVVMTLRDYVSDLADGHLVSSTGVSLVALAADDLARVNTAIARATGQ